MGKKIDNTAPRLKRRLRELADPKFRVGQQRFFKESARVLGVRTPEVRRLASEAANEYRKAKLVIDEILEIGDRLWKGSFLEERALGIFVVSKFKRQLERRHWKHFDAWVDTLSNWAETDGLCGYVLAPLVKIEPALARRLPPWTRSGNRWRRRSAAVTLVPFARYGEQLEVAFDICDRLAGDRDDMVEKGIGWLLKEASRTQPDAVADFLLTDIDRFSRTTVRYACEKLPKRLRAKVMSA